MAYKTDGSSHRNGINNEDNLKAAFEDCPNMFGHEDVYGPLTEVEKQGGTKNKNDLLVHYSHGSCAISAKNWKGSTHDWANDSATVRNLSNIYPEYNQIIERGMTIVPPGGSDKEWKERQRKVVKQAGSDQIDWFNKHPSELKSFLKNQFEKIKIW